MTAKSPSPDTDIIENERQYFRALILENPNYFGTVADSPLDAIADIQLSTKYESIGCVGLEPELDRLEAVVYVNEPFGYGGGICTKGTKEYVRFFLSYNNGATWIDQGVSSFNAYDIPEGTVGRRRLEYAVSRPIDPRKRFCSQENTVLARAILSWSLVPTPGDPDFIPVWGEVHNTYIELKPKTAEFMGVVAEELGLDVTTGIGALLDPNSEIATVEPAELSLEERRALYEECDVEVQRYAYAEINELLDQPSATPDLMAAGAEGGPLAGLDDDNLLEFAINPDGNTSYEELECIGLNPNLDQLVGVIRVKKPFGYSGGPCTKGSREYVTFWADFDGNSTFETCLGTTSVVVHDYSDFPDAGLEYAVVLPVDLRRHRQPCEHGPKLVPIRAILSWQAPAPCWNPDHIPVWGNREHTVVHITPGRRVPDGQKIPFIESVGNMVIDDIDPVTGLATGESLAAFTANLSPFGGTVIIGGHIANTPDVSEGDPKCRYRIMVREGLVGPWQPVMDKFTLRVSEFNSSTDSWSLLPSIYQVPDGSGYLESCEDLTGPRLWLPVGNRLGVWHTHGKTGLWQIQVEVENPSDPAAPWKSNTVTVRLDNMGPEVDIQITSGGGDCGDFTSGDTVTGSYKATDAHFGSLRFVTLASSANGEFIAPSPYPAGGSTNPLSRRFANGLPGSVPTGGESGGWTLDTTGMPQCGYVIELHASDRTIVNSGGIGFTRRALVGLCIREP